MLRTSASTVVYTYVAAKSGGSNDAACHNRRSLFRLPYVLALVPLQVVLVESGESVRLGDSRAASQKSYSSLRIRAGQMFGAEEVNAGREGKGEPGYTN